MDILHLASMFGRHEFVIRRLHSLLGLAPIGGYLFFHLATNAAILDGSETYQRRADQIQALGPLTVLVIAWTAIFLPILFHGLVGLVIVTRGKRNLFPYGYWENVRYTLQRFSGVVALMFILWHVFQMNGWFGFSWWVENVARPWGGARFQGEHAAVSAAEAIRASALTGAFYFVGVLACVYHLANGLWTIGITWGVWTTPHAQRWANIPCALAGAALLVMGLGALWGMYQVPTPFPP